MHTRTSIIIKIDMFLVDKDTKTLSWGHEITMVADVNKVYRWQENYA